MVNQVNGGTSENYKGLLIQYCQERGLNQPTYTETQIGPADAPQWQVTVFYGDHTHETPEPVSGSKKFAHQVASQQVLAEIDSRRESFLAGDIVGTPAMSVSEEDASATVLSPPIEVPMPLVSCALTIANERLTTSQRARYRTLTDSEFSNKLSKLTLEIVRTLLEKAEQDKITFR